jgi:hypothetical protein
MMHLQKLTLLKYQSLSTNGKHQHPRAESLRSVTAQLFMEHKVPLSDSQEPTNGPHSQPDKSSLYPHFIFPKD